MSDFKTLYDMLDTKAARLGWTLAVAEQTQDEPEQWHLVVTKEDPAGALFAPPALGVKVSDGLVTRDIFGGDNG